MGEDSKKMKIGELSHEPFFSEEITWSIPKDKILPHFDSWDVQSPSFLFAGATWAFHIHPYGRAKLNSVGKFELVIERLNSEVPQQCVFYKSRFPAFQGFEREYFHADHQFSAEHKEFCLFEIEEKSFFLNDFVYTSTNALVIRCQMRTPKINGTEDFSQKEAAPVQTKETSGKTSWFSFISRRKASSEAASAQNPESPSTAGGDPNKDCHGISKNHVRLPSNKIVRDFKELFFKQVDCDVIIKVKGQEFRSHKNILKARSPVFASTFTNDVKEEVIEIEDCDPSCFSDFLCFLYCGILENLSIGNVSSLFAAADKYDVQDLRLECLEFMKSNLSVDTFCDTIALALQHSEKELLEVTTDYFGKNLQEIIVTAKWQSFLTEYPTQSNELLIKALISNKK